MQETPVEKESDEDLARRLQQQWLEEDNANLMVPQKVESLQGIFDDNLSAPLHLSPPPPPPPRIIHKMPPAPVSPSPQSWLTFSSTSSPASSSPALSTPASNSNRKMSFLNLFSPSGQLNPSSARNRSIASPPLSSASGVPTVLKSCGHSCSFSSLNKCCACMDLRPVIEEGTYPVYVDGSGWTNRDRRSSGYCPVCKK
eukprot:gene26002-34603_t